MRYEAGSDSMDPDIRVVGYRDGSPIAGALQDFSLPTNGSPITVTFSGAAWDGIDEFRIVQQNGTRDFYFLIDDIAVGATTLDTTPPTASIVVADTALKIGETTGVTITFSEAVSGFTNADLVVSNGTLSAVSSSDGGITWTATFTPTANITDSTNLITLDNTGVVDAAGNAGSSTTNSNNYAIDTVRPTATIVVSNSALGVGQTSLVTITFGEAVTGFTNADLTISNGTLSAVSSSDGGITWTATFTPTANITDTTNLITLDNTGVADLAGNAGSGTTNSNNYAIDTVRPTATIVVSNSALGVGQTSLVTITFSEAVTGFTSADLTISNGTLSAVSSSDGGITWTATLTPAAGITDTTNLITLANTGLADLFGNVGSGTTNSNNYAIDTVRPTATIVVADTALTVGETTGVTITFSEAVAGFTNADLIVPNGTLSAVSSSDGGVTWTATFTPSANITDTINLITLDNSGVVDWAGNAGSGTTDSNNYAIDTMRPTATIVVADSALGVGETSLVTITFSEAVTGFTNADLTISNGTLSSVSSSDGGITWTATLTPSAGITDTTNLITLDNTGVADAAGNAGSGTTASNNYAVDSQRPTATIVLADPSLKAGETSLVTFTFSEAVTGFDNSDLSIANGTLSTLSSSDGGITWTATFTPTANITDTTNLITLNNAGLADLAGNAGTGTTNSANYTIDTVRPTATIIVADTALKAGEQSLVTFTFSEAVTGFTNANLIIANGTLSAVSSSDGGTTWTATFTPTSGIADMSNVITLDNSGVLNISGNAGSGTTDSNNYTVDTVRPTAAIAISKAVLAPLETTTVTITFSEAVTGLTTADFTVPNGMLSGLATSDGGITWTATLTANPNVTDPTNVITLDMTGITDVAGNAGSGTTVSANYAVDAGPPPNVPPTLTGDLTATVAEGDSYTLTTADLNFSDPDDDAAGVRFTVSAASNGTVQVNGKAATSFTGAELAAGKVTFVHSGSETTKASFKVSVEDGNEDGSTPVASTFNLAVTPVNDAPTLTGDLKATVKEGGSYTITTADLNFSDPDDDAAGVRFTVSAASNGTVQVNGKAATSFTGAELAAGKVTFVHSGSETTRASFKVSVEDGNEDGSTPVAGTFNLAVTPVNDAPTLAGDLKATVKEGGSYTITTADLNFSDPDDSAAGVRFTVSAASNGKIQVNGKAATSFTGAELASGKVSFVHSGAESTKASFKVSVEDGNEDRSTPVARTFSLAVTPVNDAPELVATQTLRKIAEDASTASARKVATLSISDPDGGNNKLSLAGSDAKLFEIKNGALWLKKGAKLDYETNPALNVTVRLDDPSIGTKHEDWQSFKVAVTDVAETKTGTSGKDKLTGTSAGDVLDGKGGNDVLEGRGGNDILSGGSGNDRLTGGSGVDIMTGGSGRDTFVFTSIKDSAPGQSGLVNNGGYNPLSGSDKRDIITDFVHAQDKLDLSKIDADSTRSGNQDFVWRGKNDFTGKAGEVIFRIFDEKGTKNDRTIVYGDTDRDQQADFQIELTGIIGLTKGDFIL
ncbi:Ig-like domain-containing protein [Rhizobium sp. TRM96647]|nr:Ig-like domain-containing protein [Rhizobium sp. TRM96650]MCV3738876.1 Ig-like domain-containing protein [Rhizobium sp. TRM96647]MCV3761171.1 Ig-like domain-containing protein [Rhizobium sp. TRM96650]